MPGRYRSDTLEQRISIERLEQAVNIFGSFDENMRLLEQEFGVKHLPSDFKKQNGYLRSLQLSEEYGLYRQDYCGCIFSKQERGV